MMGTMLVPFLFGGVAAAETSPTEISEVYQDFENLSRFTLNNSALVNNPDGTGTLVNGKRVLRLTQNIPNESSSVFLTKQISLAEGRSFSAYFTFSMRMMGYGGADGITFTVQTKANNVGAKGGGIGYAGIAPSFAVEFDNWHNPEFLDVDGNHVGINVNGDIRSVVTAPPPGTLESGGIWHVWVDYNGQTKQMEVRMNQVNNERPATPTLTHTIDLQKVLNMDEVFVGFTAATGRAYGLQDIHTFYFNNDYTPLYPRNIFYFSGTDQIDMTVDQLVGPVGKRVVTATVTDGNGQPIANKTVYFATMFGTITPQATTDANGVATVELESNAAGKGNVRAKLSTGRFDQDIVEFALINKAPTFVKGADQTVNENKVGQQVIYNWATAIKPGPVEEAAQTVTFLVENDNPELFTTQPAITSGGTLTYTPAAGKTGTATVAVRLKDNGGTLYEGQDTSEVQTFVINADTVDPVSAMTVNATSESNGWYTSDTTLNFNATDVGAGVDYTEYRINAGAWTKVTQPVTLTATGTHAVEYRTVDKMGNVETAQSQTVRIDKTAPATSMTTDATSGENGWYTSDATLNLNATDADSGVAYTEYRINAGEWTTVTEPVVLTAAGTYAVEYRSTDNAGNAETAQSQTVRIDKTAAVTSLNVDATVGTNGWYTSDATLNLNATDADSGVAYTEYRLNAGEWTKVTGPVALTADGTHVVEYRSIDNSGNVETTQSQTLQIDKTAPVTSLTSNANAGDNGWSTSDVTLNWEATDAGIGVDYTEYRINAGEWTKVTESLVLSNDGTYTVEYRSVDKTGNVETAQSQTVRIDRVAPETSLTVNAITENDGWYTTDATLLWNATDANSGVAYTEYRINGGEWTTMTGPVTFTEAGVYVVEYRSVDNNGNVENVKSQTFQVDNTPPMTEVTVTATGREVGWYTSDATLDFVATDAGVGVDYTEYRINGSEWVRAAGPLVLTQDGTYVVEYRSVDKVGNVETTQSETVRIDRIAPETALTVDATAANNGWYTADATLNFGATDAGVGVAYTEYRINGGEWTQVTGPVTLTDEGTHVVEYRSIDKNGNVEDIKSQTLQIDKYAPVTTVTTTSTREVSGGYTADATLNFSASDTGVGVAYTEYRINGGAWVTVTGPLVLNTDGTHVVEYRSVDQNGNVETTQSQTVQIDKTAPVTSVTVDATSGSNGWYTSSATLNFSSTDAGVGVAYTEYRINGGAWVKVTGPVLLTTDGTYVVEYRSVDKFGNVETTQSRTVQIDRTAPVVELKLSQEILWSPNHKYEPVHVDVITNDPTASIVLTSITSNEVADHMHSGVVVPDIIEAEYGTYDRDFQVCAERDGTNKEGRIYTITYTVTDKAGNVTVAKAYLNVPHSMGGGGGK